MLENLMASTNFSITLSGERMKQNHACSMKGNYYYPQKHKSFVKGRYCCISSYYSNCVNSPILTYIPADVIPLKASSILERH